jgi:hypothetical protein
MRVFIPRDTGFLSFLNWFMGSLVVTKEELFPLLNHDIQKILNGNLKNFCYNDNKLFNSWFLYFEPIRFKNENLKHEELTPQVTVDLFRKRALTQGWDGSKEFMFFPIADALRRNANPEAFQRWRDVVHLFFSKHVRPKRHILEMVASLHKRVCAEAGTDRLIAVHFRNPSHVKEQGEVRFDQYFLKIDALLEAHPNHHVYLATDTELGIAVFKQRYGGILHYSTDVYRTSVDDFMDWVYTRASKETDREGFVGGKGYDSHAKVSEKMDPVLCTKMGTDVLVDILMIAKCQYFVHTISNFTITLSYVNPTIELVSVTEQPITMSIESPGSSSSGFREFKPPSSPTDEIISPTLFERVTVKSTPDDILNTKCLYFNNTLITKPSQKKA